MTNREKALVTALLCFFVVPGLEQFYIGDTTKGILAIFLIPWIGGRIITFIDIIRFFAMSNQEFDAKYTVDFKMQPVNPLVFSILAAIYIIPGVVGLFLKDRVICLPDVIGTSCLLMTKGDNIFNAKGINLDKDIAWFIQTFPPYILGLGGIFLLAAILKSSNRNT